MTISNISLVSVWVKDISESKAFYVDVLGFEEQEDIQLAEDFRWCTVRHPRQPELSVHLTTPSKPLSDDPSFGPAAGARGELASRGGQSGPSATRSSPRRASSSSSPRPSGPTASRPSCATTPATGWSWSSTAPSTRRP